MRQAVRGRNGGKRRPVAGWAAFFFEPAPTEGYPVNALSLLWIRRIATKSCPRLPGYVVTTATFRPRALRPLHSAFLPFQAPLAHQPEGRIGSPPPFQAFLFRISNFSVWVPLAERNLPAGNSPPCAILTLLPEFIRSKTGTASEQSKCPNQRNSIPARCLSPFPTNAARQQVFKSLKMENRHG